MGIFEFKSNNHSETVFTVELEGETPKFYFGIIPGMKFRASKAGVSSLYSIGLNGVSLS